MDGEMLVESVGRSSFALLIIFEVQNSLGSAGANHFCKSDTLKVNLMILKKHIFFHNYLCLLTIELCLHRTLLTDINNLHNILSIASA